MSALAGLRPSQLLAEFAAGRLSLALVPAQWLDWYETGYRAGVAEAQAPLEADLNYWYWRAVAPEEHAERMRGILADFDAQTARNHTAQRWAALDAADKEASAS